MSTKDFLREIERDFTNNFFQSREYNTHHNPYDQEVREYRCVKNGDVKQLQITLSEHHTGQSGMIAKDPIRNAKNLAIVIIALTCRAAVEGGLHFEIAYSLSDSFIKKIEDINDTHEVYLFAREAQIYYTTLVHNLKRGSRDTHFSAPDSRVRKCKNYIFEHIHDKIILQDVADALFINSNYLAHLFKKSEGITLGAFITQEKIKLAQNMLIYSNASFSEIASNLSFSSQSHLGKLFKQTTGMTLRTYREMYSVD